MNARNGKIARLSAAVRNELNERLENGGEGPEILDWLNSLAEVAALVQTKFNGVPVSKQNLSEWRQGGFEEWLLRRELCGEARDIMELAEGMSDQTPKGDLVDGVATVLAARFGGLISHWNGEVDEKVEAKARFLNGVCRSVVRLQRSTHRSNQDRFQEQVLLEEQTGREKAEKRGKLLHPLISDFKAAALASHLGGGEGAMAYARCITEILNDDVEAAIRIGRDVIKKKEAQKSGGSDAVKPDQGDFIPPNEAHPIPSPSSHACSSVPPLKLDESP